MMAPCIFIGRDGSMGLRHGEVYMLNIAEQPFNRISVTWLEDKPFWKGGPSFRVSIYSSEETFRQNWKELS